ncbi:MAG TPA: hypothetical protein VF705_09635 [Longimicrobium sp.]
MPKLRTLVAAIAVAGSAAAAPMRHATVYNGSLYDRETGELRLNLRAGYTYAYDGACDLDCSDLDFALYRWVPATPYRHAYWKHVGSDRAPDNTPFLTVTPPVDALYRLDIIMARCTREPCGYDVDVY